MKKFEDCKVISSEHLNKMLAEAEADGQDDEIDYIDRMEEDGLLYCIWFDKRYSNWYAVREFRTVYFGLNSIPQEKVDEFIAIVEREGSCKASWDCTGRSLHLMLAQQLEKMLPQYRFELGYNYQCVAHKR